MDGPVALGKTANFLATGSYHLAQCVEPVRRGNKMVRESLWFCIRESENTAVATMREVIEDTLFSPELMAQSDGPYREYGKNPKFIEIAHELGDGTHLKMTFECHGFNDKGAESRLRSRAALGIVIPEMQGIPYEIAMVARQRAGRWRTATTVMSKVIDGRKYSLSGMQQLKIVLADANIPARPHQFYDKIYDDPDQGQPIIHRIKPPSPLIRKPLDQVPQELIDSKKYPITTYEKQQVMWFPNPDCYHMTKHYESRLVDKKTGEDILDENGNPTFDTWSGYSAWYQELNQIDSIVRRNVIGEHDPLGGEVAIYQEFDPDNLDVVKKFNPNLQTWLGYDPGLYAGYILMQEYPDKTIHVFKEIVFEPLDEARGRTQIEDFVAPYITGLKSNLPIKSVVDPAALVDTSKGEGEATILRENGILIVPCRVLNQQVKTRQNCLGYYLKQGLITIDGKACPTLVKGIKGGYQWNSTKGGMVVGTVKKNKYSHPVEALQYPMVNFYHEQYGQNNNRNRSLGISRIRSK